jgi:hypothetical protein
VLRAKDFPSSSCHQRTNLIFLHLFVWLRYSIPWVMPTHKGEDHLFFSPPVKILISSKDPHRHTQKWMLTGYLAILWFNQVDM